MTTELEILEWALALVESGRGGELPRRPEKASLTLDHSREPGPRRRYNKLYRHLVGLGCANPECRRTVGVSSHHVTPLTKGGDDRMWNLVALCAECHRGLGLHKERRWRQMKARLFLWKCMQELRVLGFVVDEQGAGFAANLRRWRAARQATRRLVGRLAGGVGRLGQNDE